MLSNCSNFAEGPIVTRSRDRMKGLLVGVTTLLLTMNFSSILLWAKPEPVTTTTQLSVKSDGQTVTSLAGGKGNVVTLTPSVTANSAAVTTGQVKFCDNAAGSCSFLHVLATAQLTSAGSATFSDVPGIGSHSYTAVFLPASYDKISTSSAVALTVTGKPVYGTTTTIARSGSAGNGDRTFTVSPSHPSTVSYAYYMVAADFNGDGKLDLAIVGA